MPSVMGLLEDRERAARQRVEVLQAELQEAEAAWERFVITRQTVAEVLAELPAGEEGSPAGVPGERPARVAGAVPGSVVPAWREGLDPGALAPDYQRLVEVLAGNGEEMGCRQLAAALGLKVVAAKVEGVRSKAKRLAARGWLVRPAVAYAVSSDGQSVPRTTSHGSGRTSGTDRPEGELEVVTRPTPRAAADTRGAGYSAVGQGPVRSTPWPRRKQRMVPVPARGLW